MSLKDCLGTSLDCILGIRDDIGADIQPVYLVTRTWSGDRVGDGYFTDEECKIPTPEIVDLSHDVRVQRGGAYKSGDLILKTINKATYTEEALRTDTGEDDIEKFIKVGQHYYRTVHIKEKFLTYDIHITKVAQDETERGD